MGTPRLQVEPGVCRQRNLKVCSLESEALRLKSYWRAVMPEGSGSTVVTCLKAPALIREAFNDEHGDVVACITLGRPWTLSAFRAEVFGIALSTDADSTACLQNSGSAALPRFRPSSALVGAGFRRPATGRQPQSRRHGGCRRGTGPGRGRRSLIPGRWRRCG